jgi:ABC-type dipeptide/oligopeptide/nickel transport system permease component
LRRRHIALYVGRRLAALVPQLLGISVVSFLLLRLLPGNPVDVILGYERSPATVKDLTRHLGLDKSLPEQYWLYLQQVVQGDLGHSYFTGSAVTHDLFTRVPATLELLFYSLLLAMIVGIGLGAASAMRGNRGSFARATTIYGRLAGAFPDFWIGLIAIYFFFFKLRWAPPPLGRLSVTATPPKSVTGFYTIDSLVRGEFGTFVDAVKHLVLPVLVLGLIVAPLLAKITNAVMLDVLRSDFIRYANACGLRRQTLYAYAIRNASPPVLTVLGTLVVYLLGGAVLIEKVFSWGGAGQYAVQAVTNFDYISLQGFVLVAAAFTMLVYLVVDLLHLALDPRIGE